MKITKIISQHPAATIVSIALLAVLLTTIFKDPPPPCEKVQVVELVAANYRTVTVRLANGEYKDLDQPTVKPGDMICGD